jgi:hypothetical protein
MSTYTYQAYPRRLYLNGEVIEGDLHATNSVVVENEAEEAEARSKGYAKAYESTGGNGGSQVPSTPEPFPFTQDQDAVVSVSADPIEAPAEATKRRGRPPKAK